MITPDSWVILKVNNEKDIFFRVFACFSGGYLDGDAWKMNSGIKSIEDSENYYDFYGYSGSIYRCFKNNYEATGYGASVLSNILEKTEGKVSIVEEKEVKSIEL